MCKEESRENQRCPCCGHVSTLRAGEPSFAYGVVSGVTGEYFYCQNPKCNVERIYDDNVVMVSGK
jgi:hypothetical protein